MLREHKFLGLIAAAVIGLAGIATSANAVVVIDDFTVDFGTNPISTSGTNTTTEVVTIDGISFDRISTVTLISGSGTAISETINPGDLLNVDSPSTGRGQVVLDYTNGTSTLDFTGDEGIRVDLQITDGISEYSLFLSWSGGSDTVSETNFAIPNVIFFPFSSFTGIDVTTIDQITLTIAAQEDAADVSIAEIFTTAENPIPEPATAGLLALGALGLLARRRRQMA